METYEMDFRTTSCFAKVMLTWLAVTVFVCMTWTDSAEAVPTFARKYRTSCITCHTVFPKLNNVGEAFRRNGYQFAADDELLVKDEPIPMGNSSYKDMFPNSIWPSDLPNLPPVFIRAQQRNILNTDPGSDGIKWDMDFPHELALGGVGTFGRDISAWWEIEFEPKDIEEGEAPNVERAFIQFSNLFSWDPEEDEDGMHMGHRWLNLPRYALNLRLGKMEPQVLPHVASQHARVGVQQSLPGRQRIGANRFRFEPAQSAAVELHGIVKQYNSYVIGYANGGTVSGGQLDDNNHKDVYFRVSRKWFGYPLDGAIGQAEYAETESDDNEELAYRGQSPDEEDEIYTLPGLDFWRAWDLETGFFGWWGEAEIDRGPTVVNDYFRRIGVDARLQWFDWDIYGVAYWGHDSFAGLKDGFNLRGEDHFSYFVQADYMLKPWILGFVRYEETQFNESARVDDEIGRVVPGAAFLIRQNLKLQTEWVVDTRGNDTGDFAATDSILIQLDYTY